MCTKRPHVSFFPLCCFFKERWQAVDSTGRCVHVQLSGQVKAAPQCGHVAIKYKEVCHHATTVAKASQLNTRKQADHRLNHNEKKSVGILQIAIHLPGLVNATCSRCMCQASASILLTSVDVMAIFCIPQSEVPPPWEEEQAILTSNHSALQQPCFQSLPKAMKKFARE